MSRERGIGFADAETTNFVSTVQLVNSAPLRFPWGLFESLTSFYFLLVKAAIL